MPAGECRAALLHWIPTITCWSDSRELPVRQSHPNQEFVNIRAHNLTPSQPLTLHAEVTYNMHTAGFWCYGSCSAAGMCSVLRCCLLHTSACTTQLQHSPGTYDTLTHTLTLCAFAPRHPDATEDAAMRCSAFQAGANMVTHCGHALADALHQVALQQQQQQLASAVGGSGEQCEQQQKAGLALQCLACDWCGLPGLSSAGYWLHQQLYHINHPNKAGMCQVCHRWVPCVACSAWL